MTHEMIAVTLALLSGALLGCGIGIKIARALEHRAKAPCDGCWSYPTAIFYNVHPDGSRTQAPTYRRNILGIRERVHA